LAQQVRSLIAHVIGARFEVPLVLYKTFEAWHTLDANADPGAANADGCEELRRRFAAVFLAAARGDSLRDALRAQLPTLALTREAAHAFAAPRHKAYCSVSQYPTPLSRAFYDSPMGALRAAQLRGLGLEVEVAELAAMHLLPPAPAPTAAGERLLLDAARFLIQHGLIGTARWPTAEARNDPDFMARAEAASTAFDTLDKNSAGALSDIGFFLDAQQRAATLPGAEKPFSFSGRTLASVTRLAAAHRRDALVDAAATALSLRGSFVDVAELPGVWRAPLAWDAACDQALALRCARVGGGADASGDPSRAHAHVTWRAAVTLTPLTAGSSSSYGYVRTTTTVTGAASSTLRGEWRMARLNTWDAIRKEGATQHNCLSFEDRRYLSVSRFSSYWSLRFTPDADAEAQLAQDEALRRAAAQLRLTVHVDGDTVRDARAAENSLAPQAARKALAGWGRRAGVRVPQYSGSLDDDDDQAV
jgi:hypothetical protein